MKKSMILFISLLFIASMSILILKNLDDTKSYISQQNHELNRIQIASLTKNVKDEVKKVLDKYEDNIDLVLGRPFPLNIEGITMQFELSAYEKFNINLLRENDPIKYKEIENFFYDENIGDFDYFREITLDNIKNYKGNGKLDNSKQIDAIINAFIKETNNKTIAKFRHKFGFIKQINNEKLYSLKLTIEYLDDLVNARYILSKQKVFDFELSFK